MSECVCVCLSVLVRVAAFLPEPRRILCDLATKWTVAADLQECHSIGSVQRKDPGRRATYDI